LTDFVSSPVLETIKFFDWSPDGKQIALLRGFQIRDVALLSY
jgi:hypothetical protein